jgi:hypothetical protein
LAGTFGGSAQRECVIPSGKNMMFPTYNGECSTNEYPQSKTESDLRNCAKSQSDRVTNLDTSVDGVKIPNLKSYRAQTSLFDLSLPNNNVFGLTSGNTKSVADGYWIIVNTVISGKTWDSF